MHIHHDKYNFLVNLRQDNALSLDVKYPMLKCDKLLSSPNVTRLIFPIAKVIKFTIILMSQSQPNTLMKRQYLACNFSSGSRGVLDLLEVLVHGLHSLYYPPCKRTQVARKLPIAPQLLRRRLADLARRQHMAQSFLDLSLIRYMRWTCSYD